MTFIEAVRKAFDGKKIARKKWVNRYVTRGPTRSSGIFSGCSLKEYKNGKEVRDGWQATEKDRKATDYIVI